MRVSQRGAAESEDEIMPQVSRSAGGDEHWEASMHECLEELRRRDEYWLFDGDLYWRPDTMLRVHTPQWLSRPALVVWWPRALGGIAGNVSFSGPREAYYALVPRDFLPQKEAANFL
jgi:hypothetical protein